MRKFIINIVQIVQIKRLIKKNKLCKNTLQGEKYMLLFKYTNKNAGTNAESRRKSIKKRQESIKSKKKT